MDLNGLYVTAASAVFQGAVIGLSSVFSINYPQGVMAGMVGTYIDMRSVLISTLVGGHIVRG